MPVGGPGAVRHSVLVPVSGGAFRSYFSFLMHSLISQFYRAPSSTTAAAGLVRIRSVG